MYNVGDKVVVINSIDDTNVENGVIVYMELDHETPVVWLYIKAEKEELNINYDPRFGNFWLLREDGSRYVELR